KQNLLRNDRHRVRWLLALIAVIVIFSSLPMRGVSAAGAQVSAGSGTGFWHTNSKQIVDANGMPVRMTGINWFATETSAFCPHGLWVRQWRDMLDQIKSLGFNTLRLPFCSQLFDSGSVPNSFDANINPDLVGLRGIDIMDKIVNYCGQIGLRVF